MEKLTQIYNFFKGKRTYIIGIMMITVGYLQGNGDLILQGFSICSLRAGISNTLGENNSLK